MSIRLSSALSFSSSFASRSSCHWMYTIFGCVLSISRSSPMAVIRASSSASASFRSSTSRFSHGFPTNVICSIKGSGTGTPSAQYAASQSTSTFGSSNCVK